MKKINKYELTLIMGKAGSGKSTMMALLVRKSLKQGRKVYCNKHVLGAEYLDCNWLGKYDLTDSDIIIDEAQLEWDNRNFKSFSDDMKYFISNYRHLRCRLWILSQSYEDLDVKIRRQAHHIYIMQKSIIPYTIMLEKIRMKFGISESGTEICTMFKTGLLDIRFKLGFLGWRYFDSYECPEFPRIPRIKKWGEVPCSDKEYYTNKLKNWCKRCHQLLTKKIVGDKIEIEERINVMFEGDKENEKLPQN